METQSQARSHTGIGYEILIQGQLDRRWSEWFDGLAIASPTPTTTRLRGTLADQAALFGVLKKLHNLGLTLISVQRLGDEKPDENDQPTTTITDGGENDRHNRDHR